MLEQRRRRWSNIEPTLGQCIMFARYLIIIGDSRPTLGQRGACVASAGTSLAYRFSRGSCLLAYWPLGSVLTPTLAVLSQSASSAWPAKRRGPQPKQICNVSLGGIRYRLQAENTFLTALFNFNIRQHSASRALYNARLSWHITILTCKTKRQ